MATPRIPGYPLLLQNSLLEQSGSPFGLFRTPFFLLRYAQALQNPTPVCPYRGHGQHHAYSNVTERLSCLTLQEPSVSHLYHRRSYLLDDSLSNSRQRESLAVPMRLEDSASSGQQQQQQQQQQQNVPEDLEEEEIAPTDVKYRLQLLEQVPLRSTSSSIHSQCYKPGWIPFSKTQREWFKPWKMETVTNPELECSHSGYIQGRRTTPRGQLRHMEYDSQDQDTQALVWSHALFPGLDKSSQGVIPSIQHVSKEKEMVPASSMTHAHQEMGQTKHGIAFVGTKRTAKFNEATTARITSLPPLKPLEKKVKSRCPPNTSGTLQGRLHSELTGKQFFQDWRAQSRGRFGNNEKLLAPFEDQVSTKVTYMPLFSERVKFVSPRTVASNLRQTHSRLSKKNQPGQLQNSASQREQLEKRTA
ncbi:uncharacterized protein LOC116073550 isoform X3 [Mastomys coucha]|uniref:uncharacterized protein LOC116073550 isoform X3 n=1 Tax=Mastomys coucha TaxID=35658 RepID=UPI0012616FC1|nr:uncharacterized protein LOC116073550 isoform X3 [Mastomys coucha]